MTALRSVMEMRARPSAPAFSQKHRNRGPDAEVRVRPANRKWQSGNRWSYGWYSPADAGLGSSGRLRRRVWLRRFGRPGTLRVWPGLARTYPDSEYPAILHKGSDPSAPGAAVEVPGPANASLGFRLRADNQSTRWCR